jgi:hypothetical protein
MSVFGPSNPVLKNASPKEKNQSTLKKGRPYFEVVTVYLNGAKIVGPSGGDRGEEDIRRAAQLWEVDFVIKEQIDGSGRTNRNFVLKPGFTQRELICAASFGRNPDLRSLLRLVTQDGKKANDVIYIIYTGHEYFADGKTAGCAFPLQLPPANQVYHFIIISNAAANLTNWSLCAHELGHTFYRTVRFNRNIDPTSIGHKSRRSSPHSYFPDNVMYPTPGSNSKITDSQKDKAMQSSLLKY